MSVGEPISYAQWGIDFFHEAISEERVLGAVNAIAGQRIEIAPVGVGPGGIAKMSAQGKVGRASAERLPGEIISFRALVPVDLTFEVDLKVEKQRFDAQLVVPLTLTAVARSGLGIFIAAAPPATHEVEVNLRAQARRGSFLQRVAGIEDELRRFVAEYVGGELERPEVRRTRSIDVSRAIPEVWTSIGPEPDADATTAGADRAATPHRA